MNENIVRKKISARRLAVLLLLAAPNSSGVDNAPIAGNTRLQKLIFLVQERVKEQRESFDYDFKFDFNPIPEKFGPADLDLYQDIEYLNAMGLIHIQGQRLTSLQEGDLEEALGTVDSPAEVKLPEAREEDELSFEYLIGIEPEELVYAEVENELEKVYVITEKGLRFLKLVNQQSLTESGRSALALLSAATAEVRREFGDLPLKALLHHVYTHYKNMLSESIIKDQILRQF